MGKVLIEVLVEDPSSEKDTKLISLVKRVSSKFKEVEIRIFKRAGPHEYTYSIGILDAYKMHVVPAIVINGDLKFASKIPSEKELEKAIEDALRHPGFKVSR